MQRQNGKFFILLSLAILIAIALFGLISWRTNIPLGNGYARIKTASFFRSLKPEAYCRIDYHPKTGQPGSIILWQDVFDGPVMLISSTNSNVLLCLYDFDVDMRLFRIDTLKGFNPAPPSNDISNILFSCTWDIRYGTGDDWHEVSNYLHAASIGDIQRHLIGSSLRSKMPASRSNILKSLNYANISQ